MNLHTGKSQWERPEGPAQKEEQHAPPSGPPPSYDDSGPANPSVQAAATDDKKTLGSNNPYNQADPSNDTLESDARLAAQLQAEEDARAQSRSPVHPGAAADYYSGSSRPLSSAGYQPSQGPAPAPEPKRSRGFLSKLMGKSSSSSGSPHFGRPPIAQQQSYGYQQGGYYGGGYPRNRILQAMDILSTSHRAATILERCHRGGAAAWALQALPLWVWEAVCSAVLCSQKHSTMTMGTRSSITMVIITAVTLAAAMTLVTFEFAEICAAVLMLVLTCLDFSSS